MSLSLGPYDQYYLALVVMVGTYAAAAALLWLSQRSRYALRIQRFRGVAQNFLTVINVIFALNLAFLANDTWRARDRALDAVFQEAGSLRNILDLSSRLDDPERSNVAAAVRAYTESAVTSEWPLLARRESSREVSRRLDALLELLASREVVAAASTSVASQMLQQAVTVRSMRDLRITLSQTHVNPLKWLGMVFLGFLTMISIAMVHVDTARAQFLAVLLFATAAAPTAAIILIHGNPFQEPLAIAPTPIATIVERAAEGSH